MIDETVIIPIFGGAIGFLCMIYGCLKCKVRMAAKRELDEEVKKRQELQQRQQEVQVQVDNGGYVGGYPIQYLANGTRGQGMAVYPNQTQYVGGQGIPVYGGYYSQVGQIVYPQPTAPPGNYLTTSVTV